MKHVALCMFIALGIPAALVGCGSLDSGDLKQDKSDKAEESQLASQLTCGDTCASCVDHDDGATTCCFWVNGKFEGCDTF